MRGLDLLVLSRGAGEEGDPTQLGEVRDHGLHCGVRLCPLISPLPGNVSLLLSLKEREKT